MTGTPPIGHYEHLDFNAPMSGGLADSLAGRLARVSPKSVVDVGCGWGELLLRLLKASPETQGLGVDEDELGLERGRRNAAAAGVAGRVRFVTAMPTFDAGLPDVVICVGSDHIFGTQQAALADLHSMLSPGGRLLLGTGFWESPPTEEQAAAVGYAPSSLTSLADLVDVALAAGFRPLDLRTASRREWEEFEFGYLADWEEWLLLHGDSTEAATVRERADVHRTEYLRGWRPVLGFAYLTLGKPA